MNVEVSKSTLFEYYNQNMRVEVDQEIEAKLATCNETEVNFDKFGEKRMVSALTQFTSIFSRNVQYLFRNPRSLKSIFLSGAFSAVLNLCLFWQVGDLSGYNFLNPDELLKFTFNMKGLSFLIAQNLSFGTSSSVIL